MEERLEEGFVREWAPCTRVLGLLPPRVHAGLFSTELRLTCVDAVSEYLALGTNVGLVYWYSRKKGTIERLRSEATQSSITCVKIVNTVDYMVAAGNTNGQVSVFQIPKELPDSVPDTLKPKTEPKVERYTIGELHNTQITAIEWSKNGMRLFSGDKNGVIIMTEIDFYMHLCKSVEIVNEQYEIVQISYHQNSLLVSSLYRTILCERRDARWEVNQVGKKERKSLVPLGAVFQWSFARGGAGAGDVAAYCARPGLRLWRADKTTDVHQTLLFKDAVANPMTVAELLNPSHTRHSHANKEFGPLHVFREHFLLTHNADILYILDPRSLTAVAVVDDLRRILSVSVNKDEIFILEGERSLVRLGHAPEIDSLNTGDDPIDLMTKSLSSSIQLAVSTVRELAQLAPPAREPPADAEECFELPPVRALPPDVPLDVLESMIQSFESAPPKSCVEELQRKVELYNAMADDELIFSSRRNRRRDAATPKSTPAKRCARGKGEKHDSGEENGVQYNCTVIDTTDYKIASADESDEEMRRQIEEKEKILAKMLDLESLSIPSQQTQSTLENWPEHAPATLESATPAVTSHNPPVTSHNPPVTSRNPLVTSHNPPATSHNPPVTPLKADAMTKTYPILIQTSKRASEKKVQPLEELVPKMAQVPPNWNLGSLQVATAVGGEWERRGTRREERRDERLSSPDGLEAEWEFV